MFFHEIYLVAVLKDLEMESAADRAFVNMVLVDMNEYARQYSDKALKKTLSIPMWLNTLCAGCCKIPFRLREGALRHKAGPARRPGD